MLETVSSKQPLGYIECSSGTDSESPGRQSGRLLLEAPTVCSVTSLQGGKQEDSVKLP